MFSSNIVKSVQSELLARGIPELSFPIGHTNVAKLNMYGSTVRNFDMNLSAFRRDDEAWPQRDGDYSDDGERPNRWLHSDLMNLPHYYTHKLFKKLVEEGDMK